MKNATNSSVAYAIIIVSTVLILFITTMTSHAGDIVFQPGPDDSKDIWTTSVYSYAPGGSFPGGGLDNYELVVGGWGDLYYSLLQFDLVSLPKVATSARLELFCFTQRGVGTTGIYLDRITQFWDWKTQGMGRDRLRLWWDDRPLATQWFPQALPAPAVGQWFSTDITDLYNGWQAGIYPNFGIQLRPVSNGDRWAEFYSSEYQDNPSLRPRLIIEPSQPPSPMTLGEKAAALAKMAVGGNYILGAKGWDWKTSVFVGPGNVKILGYRWNFDDPMRIDHALDCSGLPFWSYNKAFGALQYQKTGNPVYYEGADGQYRNNTAEVNDADLKPGDLLFFNAESDDTSPPIDHVAMYVGCCDPNGNDVVQAEIGRGIIWSKKDEIKHSIKGFVGYGRITTPKTDVRFLAHSPVDLVVTDPDGYTISPGTLITTDRERLREIPGVLYYAVSAIEANGSPETVVTGPNAKSGNYLISVIPRLGARAEDTYTLDAELLGTIIPLAQNVRVDSIPALGYGINISGSRATPFIPVAIDIKPGSNKSPINLRSKGVTPIAILSTAVFEATIVDVASLRLGLNNADLSTPKFHFADVNGDGRLDLIVDFPTQRITVNIGESNVVLTGRLFNGHLIRGVASVSIVPK